ncbi:conserved Plasmodium protein, unknown function [Plasmodium gallinaceum]|uniref:Spindle and centriole-associated protein 1 n=1 Tax=Plasmodium gallinaceum TaxID=5849 RepID=A0A1J1GWG9_PLAGA|nr:conserved Plasmodium protein, unknown function [Plasmodium gallinaceum]CRG96815.1 conserved Plasmodium protein, unknown function [Plasmodium gallinaceum]
MKIFSESDYSDIANDIITNYEENKKENARKLKKNNLLSNSNNNSDINDSLFFKKVSNSNENKLLTNSYDNNENSSYNSLVDDFYDQAIKKLKKSKQNSTNFIEDDNNNILVNKPHIIKKDENKLIIKKKVIQRNNEILKKNLNKPLMPLLKKKNITKKKDIRNKKVEQVSHKNEWNSNQNDLDKYRLSKEELEQKKINLKSKNIDKVKIEYQEKLKNMRQKQSLVTSKGKEKNNCEKERHNISKLSEKGKEKKIDKNLMENINSQEIDENLVNKKKNINVNNKKNHFKYNIRKKFNNSQKIDEENTININNLNNVNVSLDLYNNENCDIDNYNNYDANGGKNSSDDMKNSKKHIYEKINKKKGNNINNNNIKLEKNKINRYNKSYSLNKLKERSQSFLNNISDSDFYENSMLNISNYKKEVDDSFYFPKSKQIYDINDTSSLKKKKLNHLDDIKENFYDFEMDNNLNITTDSSSNKTTIDNFMKELKNHNENLCIDINPNNIKIDIENYKIDKKVFKEKEYYPNTELKFLDENISTKNSCSSNYDYEYIFDSDYSEQINKMNDNLIKNDNMLKLKKSKIETFNHIKKIIEEIKNLDYENVNTLRNDKNEIKKNDDYMDMVKQNENNKLYCCDSEDEKIEKKKIYHNIKKEKTKQKNYYENTDEEIKKFEKKDYYKDMDEKIEKKKVYPLMELLFKEDDDNDYYIKDKSSEYYKEEENEIFNENNDLYKKDNIFNSYNCIFNDKHNPLHEDKNCSDMMNFSEIKCFSNKRRDSKNQKLNHTSSFSSFKNSFDSNFNIPKEYSYNLSEKNNIKNNIEYEKNSYISNSIELMNKLDSNTTHIEKNTSNAYNNNRDYLKKNNNEDLIFSNSQSEKNDCYNFLKNTLLNKNTKISSRNDKEKNENIKQKIDRGTINLIKNELKSNCSKLNMDDRNTHLTIQRNDKKICETPNKKIEKKYDQETASIISNSNLHKKGKKNIFCKKNVNEVKNIKNCREIEHLKRNNKETPQTKNSKDITDITKNNINKRTRIIFNKNKDNEISSEKKEKGKEDTCANKEHRLINQKILNTSLNFDDTHNLSDDDKFIFDTYLNEENTKKKEENLSEIINSQVKAFERIFL